MKLLCFLLSICAPVLLAEAETAEEHAKKIVIPEVNLRETPIREALEFLGQRAAALDTSGKGINIVFDSTITSEMEQQFQGGDPARPGGLANPAGSAAPPEIPGVAFLRLRINLSRRNVPLDEALSEVAKQGYRTLRWDPYAAVVVPIVGGQAGKAGARPEVHFDKGVNQQAVIDAINKPHLHKVDFRESSVREALEFLHQRAKALDPDGAGVNVHLVWLFEMDAVIAARAWEFVRDSVTESMGPSGHHGSMLVSCDSRRIIFTAVDMPTFEILRYVAELARFDMRVGSDTDSIHFVDKLREYVDK